MYKFSTSMMCANTFDLPNSLPIIEKHTDLYHIDIMDGHFVPNLALSFDYIEQLKKQIKKPIDTHLMVEYPMDFINKIIEIGVGYITLHPITIIGQEQEIFKKIKSAGIKVGIAISPSVDLKVISKYLTQVDKITIMTVNPGFAGQKMLESVLPKIAEAKELREKYNLDYLIEVDGSNNFTTFEKYLTLGADVFVLGTGLFNNPNLEEGFQNIKEFFNNIILKR